jgi:uncharacterized protein YbjQ (UPF0145 family)
VLITTSVDLPGHQVVAVQGDEFGLTVRCRNIGTGYLARLRSIGRGENPKFTKLLRSFGPSTAGRPGPGTQPPVASNERPP